MGNRGARASRSKMYVTGLYMSQARPEFAGRLAHDLFEDAIEMSQRLKPNFIRNLANAEIGIQKQVAGVFDPDPGEVFGEVDAAVFFEHFTKIKGAGVNG